MPEVSEDGGEQRLAEAEVEGFRKDLGPFVVAAETTRMPMVFTDAKASGNPVVFANDSFLMPTGYDRAEVLGQSFNSLMALGDHAGELERIETTEGSSDVRSRRKDGTEFWAALFISPVQDEKGDVVQHFASFVDLPGRGTSRRRPRCSSTN